MRIHILQELQPYSKTELQKIFELEDNEVVNILNSLSSLNILKTLPNNISKIELEDLLEIESLDNQNLDAMYIFKYVGMLSVANICLIIYPKYINNCMKDKENNYKKFKEIIAVIRKYQYREQKQRCGDKQEENNFNLLSVTLDLIEDYLENGLYWNEKYIVELNGEGEILWEKTINESIPYFINNIPIYLDTFTVNQENNEEDYFRRLHSCILVEAYNKIKDILSIIYNVDSLSNISFEKRKNFGNLEYIILKLNQELSTQFITKKQNTLNIIKKYLLNENNNSLSKNISYIGTTNFNLVWEDVCSVVMENCLDKTLKELCLTYNETNNIKLIDVIEKPLWIANISQVSHRAKKTLTPDIIRIKGNNFEIYDAKYYKIRLDENGVKNQPGVTDITKQYLYELAYQNFIEQNKLNIKRNAFLMPIDEENKKFLGVASMKIFSNIENLKLKQIEVILVPCEKVYKEYLNKIRYV